MSLVDIPFDAADENFRAEVRHYLMHMVPLELRQADAQNQTMYRRERRLLWSNTLARKGWLVADWPREYGGSDLSVIRKYILREELIRTAVDIDSIGIGLVAPVIYTYGNPTQKERYLTAIREGREFWCQGFSEPNAGSDTGMIATLANRVGQQYVVNGHKIWTTLAHQADMMFALVKVGTPGRAQRGLTFMLIDMHSPGVRVQPVRTIDGVHHLNEVFLEDVKVPCTNVIGEEGKGWTYARFLLGNERAMVAGVPQIKNTLERVCTLLSSDSPYAEYLKLQPSLQTRLVQIQVDALALEHMVLRVLTADSNDAAAGQLPSLLKVMGAELRQRSAELLMDVLGDSAYAVPDVNTEPLLQYAQHTFLYARATSMAGGTSEIQRNLIAAINLGL